MSLFILLFSRFDVNLFRHRHFRFIISVLIQNGVKLHASSRFKEVSEREGRFLLFSSEISLRMTTKLANEMDL